MKINKRFVDSLKPDPERDVFAWDPELRGFGIRIKPSGAAAYLIQYRNAHAQTRRLVLGRVGTLTPDQARKLARDKLAAVAKESDPSAERREARQTMTVSELCDWYIQEAKAGRLLGRRGKPIKPSTLAMDQSRIATHIKPLIGPRAVRGLKLADIEHLQADIAAGRTAKPRRERGRGGVAAGGAGVAARTVGMLGTILEHATRKGLIPSNPARGVRKIADRKRERRLSEDEIAALGQALRSAEHDGESRNAIAAIRFILLSGFRRLEALGLRAEWIDAKGPCVRFPDTKSGSQVRPIGRAALKLLHSHPRPKDSPWSFPAEHGEGHFVGLPKALDRICGRAGLAGVTAHTLRHTFASVAGEMGFSEPTIAGLLGHAARSVTGRYIHLDQALVLAADQVSARIAGFMGDDP